MKRLVTLALLGIAGAGWINQASAVTVTAGQGVSFNQIDYLFGSANTSNSATGQMNVDIQSLQTSTGMLMGYLNVRTAQGWVVKNFPVLRPFAQIHNEARVMSTKFKLAEVDGTDITQLNASASFTSSPLTSFSPTSQNSFPVGNVSFNAAGFTTGTVVTTPPPPDLSTLIFTLGGSLRVCNQPKHNGANVQTANNQCGPAAVANSLNWLNKIYDPHWSISYPQSNNPGLGGDGSLVGALDIAMGRAFVDRTNGSGVSATQFLGGKLSYLADNGLGNKLDVKHQSSIAPPDGPGGGDYNFAGLTSLGMGNKLTADFLYDEVCNFQDVEVGYLHKGGGGHAIDLKAAGTTLGVPWIIYSSDHLQTDQDPTDSQGTDQVDFSYLVDTDGDGELNLVNEGSGNAVLAVSESPKAEADFFQVSGAVFNITIPGGPSFSTILSGPSTVVVDIDDNPLSPTYGKPDGSGVNPEYATTQMVQMTLTGSIPIGPISVKLNPNLPTMGRITENSSLTLDKLDLPPFNMTPGLTASSFFDVFFEVEVDAVAGSPCIYQNNFAYRMTATINQKPPTIGDSYLHQGAADVFLISGPAACPPTLTLQAGVAHVPRPRKCDANLNGHLDSDDIKLIFNARNTPVLRGDWRDVDSDSMLTVTDARKCQLCLLDIGHPWCQ